jgi:hypothetical protein
MNNFLRLGDGRGSSFHTFCHFQIVGCQDSYIHLSDLFIYYNHCIYFPPCLLAICLDLYYSNFLAKKHPLVASNDSKNHFGIKKLGFTKNRKNLEKTVLHGCTSFCWKMCIRVWKDKIVINMDIKHEYQDHHTRSRTLLVICLEHISCLSGNSLVMDAVVLGLEHTKILKPSGRRRHCLGTTCLKESVT